MVNEGRTLSDQSKSENETIQRCVELVTMYFSSSSLKSEGLHYTNYLRKNHFFNLFLPGSHYGKKEGELQSRLIMLITARYFVCRLFVTADNIILQIKSIKCCMNFNSNSSTNELSVNIFCMTSCLQLRVCL